MEMKRKNESRPLAFCESRKGGRNTNHEPRLRVGSALILAVVLTSLLAIVGMMFVMVARVDRIATSAISENKTLDSAVEVVVARISQVLVSDVPGVAGQPDYYDYPGQWDRWLASLEPYDDGGYKWRQISDVTGFLEEENWDAQDIEIDSDAIIEDHEEIVLDDDGNIEGPEGQLADADGDGVADSKWIELDDITSSKGKTIFAAIRIIDNGGMLNVNTAYRFNPASPGTDGEYIDGSDQMQINLLALAQRNSVSDAVDLDNLDEARFGSEPRDMDNYLMDVVWRYYVPDGEYTPFDISDELELRNRYTLNRSDVDSRIEVVWVSAFRGPDYLRTPVDLSSSLGDWEEEVYFDDSEPNADSNYSYRHIGTTYNMDRIIRPYGGRMLNINDPCNSVGSVYSTIRTALIDADPNFVNVDEVAAQVAVNLIDFRDENSDVETFRPDVNSPMYYGFEQPCVYISELAHRFVKLTSLPTAPIRFTIRKSYAVELYKPYLKDKYPDANQWRFSIEDYSGSPVEIDWSGTKHFHVVLFEDPCAPLKDDVDFDLADKDPCFAPSPQKLTLSHNTVVFDVGKTVRLERRVDDVNDVWIPVDSQTVPVPDGKWWAIDDEVHSIRRDITLHKNIRRLWSAPIDGSTLGGGNNYTDPSDELIQAHPENEPFTNVGEIGMVFRKDVYDDAIVRGAVESDIRLNLADPNYHGIFKYLTVWPPSGYALDPNEVRIKGRININTAPWYVIAQLPWVRPEIARAIVAYRDKVVIPDQNDIDYGDREVATGIDGIREEAGFESIGELATVVNDSGEDDYSMRYYTLGAESGDMLDYPDLSYNDGAEDDFEERDVIFARLSNLVTVRSDVFTAYILVRIGADGPQKRVMAILDRSNVYTDDGRVQIVVLHPVADPR